LTIGIFQVAKVIWLSKMIYHMNDKQYPPEKYAEYVEFYKKIYQADKQKAILAKTL